MLLFSVLASVLLNLLLAATFLFTTISAKRQPPPMVVASAGPFPIPEPTIEAPSPSRRTSEAPQIGGAAPIPALTVATRSAASLSMSVPDLPSPDAGFAGSSGMGGISPGAGAGFGSFGSGFGVGLGDSGISAGSDGSMKVGKISVKAQRLGVVLDVSGSMKEKLPIVKQEIRSAFRSAKTVEVEGCRLDWKESDRGVSSIRLRAKADSVIEAVEMLVSDGRVDAIYWFSDLQDGETEQGLARLRELLQLDKGRSKAVRLYIRSLEVKPSPQLTAIVRASRGSVQAGD